MHELLTPLRGTTPLSMLDLRDRNTQFEILNYDKHQTLEGLQIEPFAMAYTDKLADRGVKSLDVVTIIAKQKGQNGKNLPRCIFIWDRSPSEESSAYIRLMQRVEPRTTYTITYSDKDKTFYCHKPGRPEDAYPLQNYLKTKRQNRTIVFPVISSDVRDIERQMSAFWGRLSTSFRGQTEFENEVLLNRIIKNFAIQPFFTWLWDLDRIISYRGRFWEVELKHKYPFRNSNGLAFGINSGQLRLIRDLGRKGMKTLHLILVKPEWNKNADPGYIYNQKGIQQNVLLIGTVIDQCKAEKYLAGNQRQSDATTSYTGNQKLGFYPMPASDFFSLGTYEDPVEKVAGNILKLMEGQLETAVTDEMLENARIK